MVHLRLEVDDPLQVLWKEEHPGCVVRLQQIIPTRDSNGIVHTRHVKTNHGTRVIVGSHTNEDGDVNDGIDQMFETALAVAHRDGSALEVIVAPPAPYLHEQIKHVNQALLSLPDGTHEWGGRNNLTEDQVDLLQQLYVHPVISGFYNMSYQYLMDYLHELSQEMDSEHSTTARPGSRESSLQSLQVVLVATGTGLAGIVSALEALLGAQEEGSLANIQIHVYYGVRDSQKNLAFRDRLEEWVEQGRIRLTVVDSSASHERPSNSSASTDKFYVQHAVAQDLKKGILNDSQSVFVSCGHLAVMDAIKDMIPSHLHSSRLFLNI